MPELIVERSKTPIGPSRWRTAWTLLPTAWLLALAYFCGVVFYEQSLSAWGFEPSLFPINAQQVYVQAFLAVTTLGEMLMEWIPHHFLWLMLVVTALIGIEVLRLPRRWIHFRQTDAGQRLARWWASSPSNTLSTRMALYAWYGVLAIAGALVGIVVLDRALTTAARHSVTVAWSTHALNNWAQVTWKEEDGTLQTGRLKSCSEKWCAVIQDRMARVVAAEQIKRIEKLAPVASEPAQR